MPAVKQLADYQDLIVSDGRDVDAALRALSSVGATACRGLREEFRLSLFREAQTYPYTPVEPVVGHGNRVVRQELGSFDNFPADSGYALLRRAFQYLVDRCLHDLTIYPFKTPLRFNSMVLQRYDKGSIGITPHRDRAVNINLVCIFMIAGRGKFYVCSDRSGRDATEIDSSPGNVICLRAPGFNDSVDRPFHYVANIDQTRYTFALRQVR